MYGTPTHSGLARWSEKCEIGITGKELGDDQGAEGRVCLTKASPERILWVWDGFRQPAFTQVALRPGQGSVPCHLDTIDNAKEIGAIHAAEHVNSIG